MSKVMVTITGPFDGGDPAVAPMRTFSVGDPDPATLARRVADWAHDVTLHAVSPEAADDEPDAEPERLWDDVA